MQQVLVPIAMFVSVAAVFVFFFWFRFRARAEAQHTIRTALERGHELTPEVIDRLGHPRPAEDSDRRKATISIALGIALVAFGFILDERDAVRPFLAISAFPFALGIGFLVMSAFSGKPSS